MLSMLANAAGLHVFVGIEHRERGFEGVGVFDGLLPRLGFPPMTTLDEAQWISLIHPDDHDRYHALLGWSAVEAGVARAAYRVRGADGRIADIEEIIAPVDRLDPDRISVIGVAADVTAMYGLHRRAQDLAERLKVLFWDVIIRPDGSFDDAALTAPLDVLRTASDHVFLGGYAPDGQTTGEAWRSRIHPDDVAVWEQAFLPGNIRDAGNIDVEYRMIGYDGIERIVSEVAAIRERLPDGSVRLDGVVRDVTVERRAVDRTRELADRLRRVTTSLQAYMYEGDFANGTYSEPVPDPEGLAAFLGEPVRVGANPMAVWEERILPEDLARYREWSAAFVPSSMLEYRMRRPDGAVRVVADYAFDELRPDGVKRSTGVVLDITDVAAARERAREHEQRLVTVLESVDQVVATVAFLGDGRRVERFCSPGVERLLGPGLAGVDVLARLVTIADQRDGLRLDLAVNDTVADLAGRDLRVRLTDGRVLAVTLHPRPLPVEGGVILDCLLADATRGARETAALAAARDDAVERLHRDDLTGIGSRSLGLARLTAALADGAPVGVCLLDIDHFKRVNDTFRHRGGDAVLRAVAGRLQAAAGAATIARFGGEEFLLVLPDVDAATARAEAERIRRAVTTDPVRVDDDDVRISLSGGLAWLAHDATPEEAVDAADRALLVAKRRGRDRLVHIDDVGADELFADDPDTLRLAQAMSEAVAPMVGESERHCELVSRLAGEVAAELGLGTVARLRCRIAGMLHDVGKIAVSPEILGKPGPLDSDERLQMQRHAEIGARMVRGVGGLADAATAIHHHHERHDGRGYPDGLEGDAIPVEARIIGIVDAWSAMVERRVYREPLDRGAAIREVERASGSQFDPVVAEAFLRVVGRDGQAVG
jgi:diguanylate cyclase (GGDEF)-like protein/putative nucleotidyltransferase with HDIG domain